MRKRMFFGMSAFILQDYLLFFGILKYEDHI